MEASTAISEERFEITNQHGEKMVGVLHNTGSKKVVIICHGFNSTKDDNTMVNLAAALAKEGISAFRFDFSGNGESEGVFEYGHYRREADDLHSVVLYFSQRNYNVIAVAGHSKGGNVVLLYASMYDDVKMILNLSGRFDLRTGVKERLGVEFMQIIEKDGYIDVKDRKGTYRVTKHGLMDRLNTDMTQEVKKINDDCRILTIHGSKDRIVPVQDAYEFAKLIPNHKLHIIKGANHGYTEHLAELALAVIGFITSS
ncbi:Alpha/beta-Hydrolases superfamily protein [Rhynchospora pubera]|uniref:Alpha/beta-Hydrolases superfamily protein n=1 Tax=Rhynchospora pubera TaxID=906938 RepID=A0AAV8C526_9POAL|nr:Alpha/beta-Hydrolases superfamily protein [Rhynchospora pubera]